MDAFALADKPEDRPVKDLHYKVGRAIIRLTKCIANNVGHIMALSNLQALVAGVENSPRLDAEVKSILVKGDITTTSLFSDLPQGVVDSLERARRGRK